jgi:hypothetical protein
MALSLALVIVFAGCGDDASDDSADSAGATDVAVEETGNDDAGGPVAIMAIGDSFTDRGGVGTYRCHLDRMLTEAGVSFDFVGTRAARAGVYTCPHEFDMDHEAVIGDSIDNRAGPVLESVELLQPDVALVLLGAADIRVNDQPSDEAAAELASFIEDLRAVSSDITILVAQLMPCDPSHEVCEEGWPAFNDAIASFGDLSTERSSVTVVDMYTGFNLDDLPDGFHPNDAGDEEMAKRWMAALAESGAIEA